MKIRTKMMALGAVAALMVSGAALAFLPSTEVAASDDVPIVDVETASTDLATLNLSVNVLCRVEGESITLAGVNVTVYKVNITENEDCATIVIDRVAEGLTDADGNVTFQLPEGEYAVSASYQGLRGFDWVNLTEDQISTVRLHGCNWDLMRSQSHHWMNGSCDRDRDRFTDRGMDDNSSCCRSNLSEMRSPGSMWEQCCGPLE